jgi:hypothetical protein
MVGELRLGGERSVIAALDDEVDLVLASVVRRCPTRASAARVHADVECHERLDFVIESRAT